MNQLKLYLQQTNNDNNGEYISGWRNQIVMVTTQSILDILEAEIDNETDGLPKDYRHIEIRVIKKWINEWLEECKEKPQEPLCLAIIQTSGGYTQFDLEYEDR